MVIFEKDNFEIKKDKSVFYFINIQVKLLTKKECKMLLKRYICLFLWFQARSFL